MLCDMYTKSTDIRRNVAEATDNLIHQKGVKIGQAVAASYWNF